MGFVGVWIEMPRKWLRLVRVLLRRGRWLMRGLRYIYRYMWAFEERQFQDGEGSKIAESRGTEASY